MTASRCRSRVRANASIRTGAERYRRYSIGGRPRRQAAGDRRPQPTSSENCGRGRVSLPPLLRHLWNRHSMKKCKMLKGQKTFISISISKILIKNVLISKKAYRGHASSCCCNVTLQLTLCSHRYKNNLFANAYNCSSYLSIR